MSKYIHISHTESSNILVSSGCAALVHMLNGYDISQFNKLYNFHNGKISDIGCAPPFWIVLIRWYPYCLVYWLDREREANHLHQNK